MVKQLLARGANARDYNNHGRNALHRAHGRPLNSHDAVRKEIVAMIFDKDREGLINARCTAGKTSLHLGSESGNTPIVHFLLTKGADLEARDAGKQTSLVLAIDSGWPKAVELLLNWGAKQDVEDLIDRTPYEIARKAVGGSRQIQALLEEARKINLPPGDSSQCQAADADNLTPVIAAPQAVVGFLDQDFLHSTVVDRHPVAYHQPAILLLLFTFP